jgi:outer membrane receptor protein involved in Fe transport
MKKIIILSIFNLISIVIFSQNTIKGIIRDFDTKETLPGVLIKLDTIKKVAKTDLDGKFIFENIPNGQYTLTYKYPLYELKTDNINLNDQNITIEVTIEKKVMRGKQIVIKSKAPKENTSSILVEQKNAAVVSDGISSEAIKKTPDTRTSDVIKRISGASIQDNKFVVIRGLSDRYNFGMINDCPLPSTESDKKAFSFDIFPSNMLGSLVITKTATPDLPGEFAGGVINIKTSQPKLENFQTLQLSSSFNTITTFKDFYSYKRENTDWLGYGNTGSRLIPSSIPSTKDYEGLTNLQKSEYAKSITPSWNNNKITAIPNFNIQYSIGRNDTLKNKNQIGYIFAYTYQYNLNTNKTTRREFEEQSNGVVQKMELNDSVYTTSILNSAMFNLKYAFNDSNKITLNTLYSLTSDDRVNDRKGVREMDNDPRQWEKSINFWYSQNQLLTTQLTGEHTFKKSKINWTFGTSNIDRDIPNQRRVVYQKTSLLESDTNYKYAAIIQKSGTIPTAAGNMFWASTNERIYSGKVDYTKTISVGKIVNNFKTGIYIQNRTRDFSARNLGFSQYKPSGKKFADSLLLLSPNEIFNVNNLGQLSNGKGGFKLEEATKVSDNYQASSLLQAGYLMTDSKIGEKLRIIGGARIESYNQKFNYIEFGSNIDKHIDTTVVDILPSINLVYSLNKKSNLRLAYYKTVSRPEFRELAPFAFYNFLMDNILSGNPNLKRATVDNYDVRYELFPSNSQVFSVSGFYKQFFNPIELINRTGTSGAPELYYTNIPKVNNLGLELEYRIKLNVFAGKDAAETKIVSFLKKSTLYTNLSLIKSNVELDSIVGSGGNRPMQGQSPYIVNAGYNYETETWGMSINYNIVGQRIYIVGNVQEPSVWENSRNVIDVQFSKKYKEKFEFKLNVKDLLAQKLLFFQDLNHDMKYTNGVDNRWQEISFGQTISLSANYKF